MGQRSVKSQGRIGGTGCGRKEGPLFVHLLGGGISEKEGGRVKKKKTGLLTFLSWKGKKGRGGKHLLHALSGGE